MFLCLSSILVVELYWVEDIAGVASISFYSAHLYWVMLMCSDKNDREIARIYRSGDRLYQGYCRIAAVAVNSPDFPGSWWDHCYKWCWVNRVFTWILHAILCVSPPTRGALFIIDKHREYFGLLSTFEYRDMRVVHHVAEQALSLLAHLTAGKKKRDVGYKDRLKQMDSPI